MIVRPILFSSPMVRALLAGTKTQTRRIAKFVPHDGANLAFSGLSAGHYDTGRIDSGWVLHSLGAGACWIERTKPLNCPYGVPGDRLWVRETWARQAQIEGAPKRLAIYKADGELPEPTLIDASGNAVLTPKGNLASPWIPSIHMPRAMSRITLEVTGVRVQRLQDVTEADAIAEGMHPDRALRGDDDLTTYEIALAKDREAGTFASFPMAIARYALLWDSINGGTAPWASNPWVWVIEFRRAA